MRVIYNTYVYIISMLFRLYVQHTDKATHSLYTIKQTIEYQIIINHVLTRIMDVAL